MIIHTFNLGVKTKLFPSESNCSEDVGSEEREEAPFTIRRAEMVAIAPIMEVMEDAMSAPLL